MIATISPAFEYLRKHKNVSGETESLVMKRIKGNIKPDELFDIFEKGISGDFGKFVVADTQTLLSWVEQYTKGKINKNSREYLNTGLLDPSLKITAHSYPVQPEDWCKEANKCFTAFLNGVNESNFHPHVYDRMMVDNKIPVNTCMKYLKGIYSEVDITAAKQRVLKEVFSGYKSKGWTKVYFID